MLDKVDQLASEYAGLSWGVAGYNCVEGAADIWESTTLTQIDGFPHSWPTPIPASPYDFIEYIGHQPQTFI